jgi:hypothetical protein
MLRIRHLPHLLVPGILLAAATGVRADAVCTPSYDTSLRWASVSRVGYATHAAVRGHFAYVTAGGVLTTVDLTDPAYPVTRAQTGYAGHGLTARADLLVLLRGGTGSDQLLTVLDLTNPEVPALAAELTVAPAPRKSVAVALHGNHAYVLVRNRDVVAVDLTDPQDPVVTSTVNLALVDRPLDIACDGNAGFVAMGASGIAVLDLADPASPVWTTTLPGSTSALAAANGLLYAGTTDGSLEIIDPDLPPGTPPLSRIALADSAPREVVEVDLSGDVAFVSLSDDGILLVDVSDPEHPGPVERMEADWEFEAVDVDTDGDLVVAADAYSGLQVWRRGDGRPGLPCGTYGLPLPGTGTTFQHPLAIGNTTVWASEQHLVDGAWIGTTSFFDLSDPAAPNLVGETGTVIRHGDSRNGLFVGDAGGGPLGGDTFVTRDVTQPTAPVPLGELAVPGGVQGGCLLDGAVAWTGFEDVEGYGVRAIDVSDPAHPFVRSELPLGPDPGSPRSLALRDDRLYVGCLMYDPESDISTGALYVVDVSDPDAPTQVSISPTSKSILGLAIDGDRLWTVLQEADVYRDRVEVRDLSNPDLPAVVATKEVSYLTTDVDARAGVACVMSSWGGVHLLRLTPDGIEACGSPALAGRATGMRIVGSRLVTTFDRGRAWSAGLQVFPLAQGPIATGIPRPDVAAGPASGLSLRIAGANPFSGAVRMQLRLPLRAPARVAVFDATGRLVRTLLDGPLDAGAHSVTWDGRDTAGEGVASGVYFLRMQSSGSAVTRKVTRIR